MALGSIYNWVLISCIKYDFSLLSFGFLTGFVIFAQKTAGNMNLFRSVCTICVVPACEIALFLGKVTSEMQIYIEMTLSSRSHRISQRPALCFNRIHSQTSVIMIMFLNSLWGRMHFFTELITAHYGIAFSTTNPSDAPLQWPERGVLD